MRSRHISKERKSHGKLMGCEIHFLILSTWRKFSCFIWISFVIRIYHKQVHALSDLLLVTELKANEKARCFHRTGSQPSPSGYGKCPQMSPLLVAHRASVQLTQSRAERGHQFFQRKACHKWFSNVDTHDEHLRTVYGHSRCHKSTRAETRRAYQCIDMVRANFAQTAHEFCSVGRWCPV